MDEVYDWAQDEPLESPTVAGVPIDKLKWVEFDEDVV